MSVSNEALQRRIDYGGKKGRAAKWRLNRRMAQWSVEVVCLCGVGSMTMPLGWLQQSRNYRMLRRVSCSACGRSSLAFVLKAAYAWPLKTGNDVERAFAWIGALVEWLVSLNDHARGRAALGCSAIAPSEAHALAGDAKALARLAASADRTRARPWVALQRAPGGEAFTFPRMLLYLTTDGPPRISGSPARGRIRRKKSTR